MDNEQKMTEERSVYERINNEPVIFRGLSSSELKLGLMVVISVLFPVCVIIGLIIDRMLIGLSLIGILTLFSMMHMGTVFQRIKRGRPDGYYQQQMDLWLSEKGLKSSKIVKYSGRWSIGRTNLDRN